jgi:hypothetical protein
MTTNITPVNVFPGVADTLMVRVGGFAPPPSYYYQLQSVTQDANGGPDIITVLKDGNIDMTEAQWNSWAAGSNDEEYQLDCVATNLGLTRV